jgi:hypothetical protein
VFIEGLALRLGAPLQRIKEAMIIINEDWKTRAQ